MSLVNYPPEEINKPIKIGKKNFEHIILWMLANNEECQWSDFTEEPLGFSTSTLSKYFNMLKSKGYVENFTRGHYKITLEGRKRFHEISTAQDKKKRLNYPPKIIKRKRNYDNWILWMVYNNNFCRWSDFLEPPLSINQSSLSKNVNLLLDKGFLIKEDKEYRITHSGKLEYSRMLQSYDLDRQSILDEEGKRIDEITKKTTTFFKDYKVNDEGVQFRFLTNVLKLDYMRVKSMLTEQTDFEKILLFLSINHPDQYPDYVSLEEFAHIYEIKQNKLTYYIDEIVENKIFPIKFFKIKVKPNAYYYFQENERLERILRAITENHITKSTYLNRLFSRPLDLRMIEISILEDISGKLFHNDLKDSLSEFLPDYINYLAYKIEKKVEFKESYDKLDAVIWQNMIDIIQSRNPDDLQFQFIGQNDVNYQLDTTILEILKPYYKTSQDSIIKVFQHLIDIKQYRQALETVESAMESNQSDLFLIMLKAIALCYLNRNKDILEYLGDKIKLSKDKEVNQIYTIIFFLSAFSSLTMGDFETARNYVNKINNVFPNHPLSYATKGLTLGYNVLYKFDNEKAIKENGLKEFDKAIELDNYKPNKALYYQLKSKILLQLNTYEESIEAIDNAIRLTPKKIEFYDTKSSILMYYNRYTELLSLLDQMLEIFPKIEKELKLKIASIYKQLGDMDTGFKIIEELLEKYPKDSNILNCKAYWHLYMNNKGEAFKVIEQVIKYEPEIGLYYDSYGEILMYFEEYDKAVEQFNKALKMSKFGLLVNETYIKLGICYKELKNYEQAIENLNRGKNYTEKCFCDLETKRKWLTIAELFITEIEQFL